MTYDKEGQLMNIATQEYKRLDLDKLRSRKTKTISTKDSLQDVTSIQWSKEVLTGEKKIHITSKKY